MVGITNTRAGATGAGSDSKHAARTLINTARIWSASVSLLPLCTDGASVTELLLPLLLLLLPMLLRNGIVTPGANPHGMPSRATSIAATNLD